MAVPISMILLAACARIYWITAQNAASERRNFVAVEAKKAGMMVLTRAEIAEMVT